MKLISMTAFVLEQENTEAEGFLKNTTFHKVKAYEKISAYANFLKQPLGLWMFAPCDDEGNVLKIIPFNEHKQGSEFEFLQHHYYDKAKERCLFGENFNKETLNILIQYDTVESLVEYNLQLTPTAIKQLGL